MFLLKGIVISNSITHVGVVFLLIITMSGLDVVTIISGGIVPPLTLAPSMSAYTVTRGAEYFLLSDTVAF